MPLDISNVMLVSEETGRRQRVRRVTFTMTDAGGASGGVFRYRVGVKDNKPIGARDRELAERHEKVRGQQGAG
ncbi:MAG: hypothetical protein KatS3mg102_0981 [Planctomycetota bacterium]|nr:MAG: hypothetical protein KatS3mg102_0981 [Planctomycetota bacterium]